MGTVASDKEGERDASESSGYTDLMEIASSLGIEDDEVGSHDDNDVVDDLEPIGAGYGGAAAAALVSDASAETPAANVPEASAGTGTVRRDPPPPPPRRASTVSPASDPKLAAVPAPAPHDDGDAAASLLRPAAAPVLAAESIAAPRRASTTIGPAASTTAAPRPMPIAEPESKKGGIWIIVAAGVLALGLGGGYWYMNNEAAKKKVAQNEVRVAAPTPAPDPEPAVDAAAEAAAKAEAERLAAEAAAKAEADRLAAEEAARLEAERLAAEEAARLEAERLAAEAAAVEVSVTQKKKGDRDKTKPDASAAQPEPEPEPKAPPVKPEPLTPGEIDEKFRAECVLNPNKAGCDELRKKSRNTTDLDATLGDKLTASQIREGFSSVKGKAKACGGDPGVTVRVKVSISGDTGNVMSADALDDHAGTALGKCVVDALKGASFPRFTSGQQGTVYPVSF